MTKRRKRKNKSVAEMRQQFFKAPDEYRRLMQESNNRVAKLNTDKFGSMDTRIEDITTVCELLVIEWKIFEYASGAIPKANFDSDLMVEIEIENELQKENVKNKMLAAASMITDMTKNYISGMEEMMDELRKKYPNTKDLAEVGETLFKLMDDDSDE